MYILLKAIDFSFDFQNPLAELEKYVLCFATNSFIYLFAPSLLQLFLVQVVNAPAVGRKAAVSRNLFQRHFQYMAEVTMTMCIKCVHVSDMSFPYRLICQAGARAHVWEDLGKLMSSASCLNLTGELILQAASWLQQLDNRRARIAERGRGQAVKSSIKIVLHGLVRIPPSGILKNPPTLLIK